MEYFVGILIILAALFFAVSLRHTLGKRRSDQIKALSKQIGYEYFSSDDGTILESLKEFSFFKQGHSRQIENIIRKVFSGFVYTVFDYEHDTYSPAEHRANRMRLRSRQTVSMFSSLPTLESPDTATPGTEHITTSNPMINIETAGKSCLIYEPEILHPVCDLGTVINQRLELYEKKINTPNHGLESTGAPPAAGTPETHP